MNLKSQQMQKSGLTVASGRIEVIRVERPEMTVKMDVIAKR